MCCNLHVENHKIRIHFIRIRYNEIKYSILDYNFIFEKIDAKIFLMLFYVPREENSRIMWKKLCLTKESYASSNFSVSFCLFILLFCFFYEDYFWRLFWKNLLSEYSPNLICDNSNWFCERYSIFKC